MNSVYLLVVLLGLSFLGSALGGRSQTLGHLGSAGTFAALGFVLGPALLGVISREAVLEFEAVGQVGSAWLALIAGLCFGQRRGEALGKSLLGLVLAAIECVGVAGVGWVLLHDAPLSELERLLLSWGIGVLYCAAALAPEPEPGSANEAWASRAALFTRLARAGLLVPVVALTFVIANAPDHALVEYTSLTRVGVNLGAGVILGGLAVLLLGAEFRQNESWGLLLGLCVLGCGAATRVGMSAVATAFMLGKTIYLLSPHRASIAAMVMPTERAVLLPIALLLGAAVEPEPVYALLAVALLGIRLALDLFLGQLLRGTLSELRGSGLWVGISLSGPSALALAAGVELYTAMPEGLGDRLLTAALCVLVLNQAARSLVLRRSRLAAAT